MPIADYPVPLHTIESFFRYIRHDTGVIAVNIANELLDKGATPKQMLTTERGLQLSVIPADSGSYRFQVRYITNGHAGVIGDGGDWLVNIDLNGNITHAVMQTQTFYD